MVWTSISRGLLNRSICNVSWRRIDFQPINNATSCSCGILATSNSQLKIQSPMRSFHLGSILRVKDDRKLWEKSQPRITEGVEGEYTHAISKLDYWMPMFPDENTPNMIVDGVKYTDLPIARFRVSKNNTIMNLTDAKGKTLINHSISKEGFKNAKKKTTIAAQAAAISFGKKIVDEGYNNVRVIIRGLGPGRSTAIQGITMSGVNIVSISDQTQAEPNCPRAHKPRRI